MSIFKMDCSEHMFGGVTLLLEIDLCSIININTFTLSHEPKKQNIKPFAVFIPIYVHSIPLPHAQVTALLAGGRVVQGSSMRKRLDLRH